MIILDNTYFQGELYLPNLKKTSSTVGVAAMLQAVGENTLEWFIDKYELEFLYQILGRKLTESFVKGLKEDPQDEIWINLKKALVVESESFKYSPIANYVFFFISRRGRTQTTINGEVKGTQSFAENVDDSDKLSKVWNDMCYQASFFKNNFLLPNWFIYKEYGDSSYDYSNLEPINALDI